MNILIVGGGSWDDTTSLGNTLSNLFSGWENTNYYNLYFRETMPNNSVCRNYFRITTKELLKKIFVPQKIGELFQTTEMCTNKTDSSGMREKKAISFIHRYGLKSVYELEDWLWYSKRWQNQKLDDFIEWVNPDIIFSFAAGNSYMALPIEYIKSKTNAKLILLVADDMHTTYRLDDDRHNLRMRKDLDRLIGIADKVYGISIEMCKYYSELYNIDVTPLYKGCFFENHPKKIVNKPLRLVYAGNLLFGRLDTLVVLVDCLEKLNKNGVRIMLDIYSSTIITGEQSQKLNRGGFSCFYGSISYSEVKRKMAEADIVLHVESFDDKQIKMVRYSFSTKIIDCLQSGSVMLAIGPKGISSIEYPRKIPGTVIVDDLRTIYDVLDELLSNENEIVTRAAQIREFALEKHDIEHVRRNLNQDFKCVSGIK